ncbi:hypothetical protein FKM82_021861 [Ascaphus truei]
MSHLSVYIKQSTARFFSPFIQRQQKTSFTASFQSGASFRHLGFTYRVETLSLCCLVLNYSDSIHSNTLFMHSSNTCFSHCQPNLLSQPSTLEMYRDLKEPLCSVTK